jgi:ATP-dependent DNA helicase DinG
MSATIIDHRTFAKTLGIEDYKYIEVGSVFDPKISPIYCPGKYSLKWGDLENNISKVVDQALKICEFYKGKNGVIHTFNFKINNAFQKAVGLNRRFLFREHGITNERIVEEHFARKDGTVLVSPSLGFGTNLLDDSGRFQIIVKLPYLPLGSNRIKTLAEKDRKWYRMKMLTHLVQMAGRCTRSETDYADTYILDGSAVMVLKQNWNTLPRWFKDRLV